MRPAEAELLQGGLRKQTANVGAVKDVSRSFWVRTNDHRFCLQVFPQLPSFGLRRGGKAPLQWFHAATDAAVIQPFLVF